MPFFKPEETSQEDKVIGQVLWHHVLFNFDNPRLSENKYNPDKPQLSWGVDVDGENMMWYIGQKSVEKALDTIGATKGTEVRVAKIRTGPAAKEVEWVVEYVGGPRDPRNIRASLGNQDSQVPIDPPSNGRANRPRPWDNDEDELNPIERPAKRAAREVIQETYMNETKADGSQYVYTPLDEGKLELIRTLARDEAKISLILWEEYRAAFPEDVQDEEVATFARGGGVSLDYDILAMDRDGRMPFAGLRNYSVFSPQKEPEDMTLLERIEHMLGLLQLEKSEYVKQLFDNLVDIHERVNAEEHAKGILKKKLGYTAIPTDQESLQSMIEEYLIYNDIRSSGGDDVEACKEVSNLCGRHPDLMPPLKQPEEEATTL